MNRKVQLGLSGLVLAASVAGGVRSCIGMNKVEAQLRQFKSYNTADDVDGMRSHVSNAAAYLRYTPAYTTYAKIGKSSIPIYHPTNYPDGISARNEIDTVLTRLGRHGMSMLESQPVVFLAEFEPETYYVDIRGNLISVRDRLPLSSRVEVWNDKSVNRSTFESERSQLSKTGERLSELRDRYLDEVPADLKSSKEWNTVELAASILAGVTALVFGLAGLSRDEYGY